MLKKRVCELVEEGGSFGPENLTRSEDASAVLKVNKTTETFPAELLAGNCGGLKCRTAGCYLC